jgi:hypothetical protein
MLIGLGPQRAKAAEFLGSETLMRYPLSRVNSSIKKKLDLARYLPLTDGKEQERQVRRELGP